MYKISRYVYISQREINLESIKYKFVFSCRSGRLLLLKTEECDTILNESLSFLDETKKNKLIENKILVSEQENEFEALVQENQDYLENKNKDLLYISIQPTAYCQLGCYYCGQEHEKVNISNATIDNLMLRINKIYKPNQHKILLIGWFGGEPLLALKEIELITNKLRDFCKVNNLVYSSKIVTNGVRLTPDVYIKLVKELDVKKIEITIDGTADFHDKRRITKSGKGSFMKIYNNLLHAVELNKEYNCTLSVRCNVDKYNYDGVIPLLRKMASDQLQDKIFFYIACVYSWALNGAAENVSMQEFSNLEINVLLEMNRLKFKGMSILPSRHYQSCLATSSESEMYDALGYIYDCSETSYAKCYQKTGLVLGNVNSNKNIKRSVLSKKFENLSKGNYPECTKCNIFPLCMGGCPKALHENAYPCPSFKYNLEDRLKLYYILLNSDFSTFNEAINNL